MTIKTSYIGLEVSDLDAWEGFGSLLGVMVKRAGDRLYFRIDEKAHRVHCFEGPGDDLAWLGWEADSASSYDYLRRNLEDKGVRTLDGDAASARLRGVVQYFHFVGPVGARHEIALGQMDADGPFVSEKIPNGFITGDQGFGHVAFNSIDHLGDEKFMREALLARLSDYIYQPMPDGSIMHASFVHTGPRHHSVAFAEGLASGRKLHHFELQMRDIVDMGKTYERVQAAGVPIVITMGQHSNDRMVTFYVKTPSGFALEVGCLGIRIDDEETWTPVTYDRISEWGHKFQAV